MVFCLHLFFLEAQEFTNLDISVEILRAMCLRVQVHFGIKLFGLRWFAYKAAVSQNRVSCV